MTIGYDRPLYVLPFDHRGTFQKNMFGWTGTVTAEQMAKIAAMKRVIYDGFQAAVGGRRAQGPRPASWWTSSSAPTSCRDAAQAGLHHRLPGREERPGRVRLRVRRGLRRPHRGVPARPSARSSCATTPRATRPEPPPGARLKRLSDYLHRRRPAAGSCSSCSYPRRRRSSSRFGGDKKDYDRDLRPELMVRAIRELQDAGVEPDVWKIEGIDRPEDCRESRRGRAARAGGTASAASSWAAARTTQGPPMAARPRPPSRGSSASPWAGRASGAR